MNAETCSCSATTHAHHAGVACRKPAISAVSEVDLSELAHVEPAMSEDHSYGPLCLECFEELASELSEKHPSSMLELDAASMPFPACGLP